MDAWVVIDFLEEVHFDEDIRINGEVGPKDIPVASFVRVLNFPVKLFSYIDYDRVLSHCV